MQVQKTDIEGLLIIEPQVFGDDRGFFVETYNKDRYTQHEIHHHFKQDNLSQSMKGVLRGLHFQNDPHAQGKLVQVIVGSVLDVAVDIRPESPTFGQWVGVELSQKNKRQFWIPAGFAHGFMALEDGTIFSYKCTDFYAPQAEGGLMWNDPHIAIDWQLEKYGITEPVISDKDQKHIDFASFRKKLQR